jgi:N4-(beta-N-acetylglucosaminyl)-L-asparaginase
MQNRRGFLRLAAMSGGFVPLVRKGLSPTFTHAAPPGKPLVVSTWDFGVPANRAAWSVLQQGGRALDAVEAGARVVEADPSVQTVGLGGFPDQDGQVTLDACIMDEKGRAGAVGCLTDIVHAVSVARRVMERTPYVMLVGEGALAFAVAEGFPRQRLLTPESQKAWQAWRRTSQQGSAGGKASGDSLPGGPHNHDTIGILAQDVAGNLSGACTTSGLAFKQHGRVGDSPIIGAGLFVDNEVGAATSTGVGEANMRISGTHTVVELMRQGYSPREACKQAVQRVVRHDSAYAASIQLGFLAINTRGEVGAYCLQPGFTYAVYSSGIPNRLLKSDSHF